MKVIMINGSPHAKGCTYTALQEIANVLHSHGIETELVQTADLMGAVVDYAKTRPVFDG